MIRKSLLLLAFASTYLILVASAPAADPGCPLANSQSNGTYCQNICERCGCDGFKCGTNCLCECHSLMTVEEEVCIESVQKVANLCDPPCDFLSELPYERVIRAAKLKTKESKLKAKQGTEKGQRRAERKNKLGMRQKQHGERVAGRRRKLKSPVVSPKEDKPKQSTPEHLNKAVVNSQPAAVTPKPKTEGKTIAVSNPGPHNKLIITPPHLLQSKV